MYTLINFANSIIIESLFYTGEYFIIESIFCTGEYPVVPSYPLFIKVFVFLIISSFFFNYTSLIFNSISFYSNYAIYISYYSINVIFITSYSNYVILSSRINV